LCSHRNIKERKKTWRIKNKELLKLNLAVNDRVKLFEEVIFQHINRKNQYIIKADGVPPILVPPTMRDQEEQSVKEIKRAEKRATEETERLAKEQVRKKAYSAREQAIEKAQEERKLKAKEQPPK